MALSQPNTAMSQLNQEKTKTSQLIFLGPWPPPFGGIAAHLKELLPLLQGAGYSVTVLSYLGRGGEVLEMDNGIKIIRFCPKRSFFVSLPFVLWDAIQLRNRRHGLSFAKFLRAITISRRINNLLVARDNPIVLTYDNDQLFVLPFIDHRLTRKIFASVYAEFFLRPQKYENDRRFLVSAVSYAEKILSCSRYCADSVNQFLGTSKSTEVIYNNVDVDRFSPKVDGSSIRKRFGIPQSSVVLMTMSRVNATMGIGFMLDHMEELLTVDPNLHILICGGRGDLSQKVMEACATFDRLHCEFDISEEDKPHFFAACDVFSAPTIANHACMGIANIEAMMTGKPVISSVSGGHTETIEDGKVGILVPFEEEKLSFPKYRNALKRLVSSKKLRKDMGAQGRKRAVKLFANEAIAEQHIRLFR